MSVPAQSSVLRFALAAKGDNPNAQIVAFAKLRSSLETLLKDAAHAKLHEATRYLLENFVNATSHAHLKTIAIHVKPGTMSECSRAFAMLGLFTCENHMPRHGR